MVSLTFLETGYLSSILTSLFADDGTMDTFLPLSALNSQFPHLKNRHKGPCLTLFPWELNEKVNVKYLLWDWYKHNCSFGPWILIIITRIKHVFINQNRNHCNQHIFPMRSKFVYCYSIKIHALGFSEFLESIFCLLLVEEAFSLQKAV